MNIKEMVAKYKQGFEEAGYEVELQFDRFMKTRVFEELTDEVEIVDIIIRAIEFKNGEAFQLCFDEKKVQPELAFWLNCSFVVFLPVYTPLNALALGKELSESNFDLNVTICDALARANNEPPINEEDFKELQQSRDEESLKEKE